MRLPLDPILQLWMDVRGDKKDEAYFWEALVQISPAYAVGFIEQVRPMVTNEKLDSLKQILNIGHPRQ